MIITGDRFTSSTNKGISLSNSVDFNTLNPYSSNTISIPNTKSLKGIDIGSVVSPNSIIQSTTIRYDAQVSIATGTTVAGVEITGMRIFITPKYSNSLILCQFQIFSEPPSIDNIYRVFKNGVLSEGVFPAYNRNTGNQHWSGISMVGHYEAQYTDTPTTTLFYYHDYPSVTSQIYYSPAIKNSSGTNVTVQINRTGSSTGASGNEIGVSYGTIWEIAQ